VTFNLVGMAGVAVQLAILGILTARTALPVALGTALAVEAALIHNFVWHQAWTWRDRPARSAGEVAARLVRFHAVNGLVSLVGNVAITSILAAAGLHPVLANLVAILACSMINFVAGERFVFSRGGIAAVAAALLIPTAVAAQGKPALDGWADHVGTVERRHGETGGAAFFALDAGGREWRQRAIAGEVPMKEMEAPGVDGGKIHHWAGGVYVPDTTVAAVIDRLLETAGRESAFYDEVTASRLLARDGDRVRVFMKLQRDAGVITANYNTEHAVEYRRFGTRATSRSVSTKIAELADAGTPREREKAPGDDHGFLWRLNAYWRFEQVGNGVLIECESVSLSRSVPLLVRPLVGPIANRIARESLRGTLVTMKRVVAAAGREPRAAGRGTQGAGRGTQDAGLPAVAPEARRRDVSGRGFRTASATTSR
jgi:putative flippase GtrA